MDINVKKEILEHLNIIQFNKRKGSNNERI